MVCCQQAREPKASHDGIGHSLHPGHSGFALQQPRWRLPWNAIVELVADIGQRRPRRRDVVANVQICRVDFWLSKQRFPAPTSVATSGVTRLELAADKRSPL